MCDRQLIKLPDMFVFPNTMPIIKVTHGDIRLPYNIFSQWGNNCLNLWNGLAKAKILHLELVKGQKLQ